MSPSRAADPETHNDRVINNPNAVELPVHVFKCCHVLPHWIVQVRTRVGDTQGVVDEDAVVNKTRPPTIEVLFSAIAYDSRMNFSWSKLFFEAGILIPFMYWVEVG
jgi:hypothetical protein